MIAKPKEIKKMKITNFNRVVSQAQQVLANVQATLNTQGVKAAKEAYKNQMQAMHEWCQNEVDTTKVNTSPVLCFMEVENKRSTEDYQKELTKATNKVVGMFRK